MAVDEINAKGGVAGYKLEFMNTDSKAKPDYSVRVAKRYITEDKVHFLFGVVSSAVGLALTEVSKQYKKIFIATDTLPHSLLQTNYNHITFEFPTVLPINGHGRSVFKGVEADKTLGNHRVIGPDYAYGHDSGTNSSSAWIGLGSNIRQLASTGPSFPLRIAPLLLQLL